MGDLWMTLFWIYAGLIAAGLPIAFYRRHKEGWRE
jgi:hypothetical protein